MTQDGRLEFAAPPHRVERPAASRVASERTIAVELETGNQDVVEANRARLAELRSRPYSTVPDFPDAVVTSVTRLLPGLSQTMTTLALKDAGLLPEDALIAGASALAFIANWLADRGYGPGDADPDEPQPGLFHDAPVGILAWLLLDWIHRSMAAAVSDDRALESKLDNYYARWSRTDFEWDITRFGRGPLLNPTLPSIFLRTTEIDDAAPQPASPMSTRRRMRTVIKSKPASAGTAVHALDHSVHLDTRARRNHAREHRGGR